MAPKVVQADKQRRNLVCAPSTYWTGAEIVLVCMSFVVVESRFVKTCDHAIVLWGYTVSRDSDAWAKIDMAAWWAFQIARTCVTFKMYVHPFKFETFAKMYGFYYDEFVECMWDPANTFLRVRLYIMAVTTLQYMLVSTNAIHGCNYLPALVRVCLMIIVYYVQLATRKRLDADGQA